MMRAAGSFHGLGKGGLVRPLLFRVRTLAVAIGILIFVAPTIPIPSKGSPVSNWVFETVDSTGQTGGCPSMAIDALGHVHIAYWRNDIPTIRYAYKNGASWTTEDVNSTSIYNCPSLSLALNETGAPAISYSDGLFLFYAFKAGGVWIAEHVDVGNLMLGNLMINKTGVPLIAYSTDGGAVKFAHRDGSGWHTEVVDRQGYLGAVRAKLGPDDAVHMIYLNVTPRSLKYAHEVAGSWAITEWDPGAPGAPNLAFDLTGKLWLAYDDNVAGNMRVRLGKPSGGTWVMVDTGLSGSVPTLLFDSRDWPRLTYCQGADLWYARWQNSTWSSEHVTGVVYASCYVSFLLDRDTPHLAYSWGGPVLGYATVGNDMQPPDSHVLLFSTYWTNRPRVVNASALDAQGYVVSVGLSYRFSADNSTWGSWNSFGTLTSPPWTWAFPFPNGSGSYGFYAVATDDSGNVEQPPLSADAVAGYDDIAPVSTALPVSPYWHEVTLLTVNATASDNLSGVAHVTLWFSYSVDNTTWGSWASFGTKISPPWSWSFPFSNGQGHYRFHTIATDNATNVEGAKVIGEAVAGYITPPDYVAANPRPSSPQTIGLSVPLQFSMEVRNDGGKTNKTAILALSDSVTPTVPFATFTIPPMQAGETAGPFTATWTPPATPCSCTASASVDYYDNITESNESNNGYRWEVNVVPGSLTSLVIGQPNYTSTATYVRSSTPLDLSVIDQGGTGINHTRYRIDNVTWIEYSSPFFLPGEGDRYVEYYSEDNVRNVEAINSLTLRVDDTPPATVLLIGNPKYLVGGSFVTSSTPLTIQAADGGTTPTGVHFSRYQIDGGGWNDYSSSFTLTGEGTHTVEYYSRDYLTNQETANSIRIIVDDSPPATTISPAAGGFDITTTFTLTATDGGSGVKVTRYRIDGGIPIDYSGGFALSEGLHNISYYSKDNLDNSEQEMWLAVNVLGPPPPNTPPTVTLNAPVGGEEWFPGSSHTINWTMHDDQDINDNLTVYVNYTAAGVAHSIVAGLKGGESFLWILPDTEATDVVVNITVIDTGGLKGWNQSAPLTIRAPPPPPEVGANYKPLVALVFAIILTVVGYWSSRSRPWKDGKDRMAVVKAFMVTTMPFVMLEAATGITSLLTGLLSMPPLLGAGTAVDLAVLLIGLAVAAGRNLEMSKT